VRTTSCKYSEHFNALLPYFGFIVQWATFLDSEGRVVDSEALKKRVFYGGIAHELRKEVHQYAVVINSNCVVLYFIGCHTQKLWLQVWPFLLGHYSFNSTYAEREYLRSARKGDYELVKLQWQVIIFLN